MDWSKIPDVLAITCLACAFYSILRRDPTPGHRLWLVGWTLIAIHFFGFIFLNLPGAEGRAGLVVGMLSLVAAAIFFMWATVPQQSVVSSRRMATLALMSTLLYTGLSCFEHTPSWAFDIAAMFITSGPLTVGLYYRRYRQHTLRWITVGLHTALGLGLLAYGRFSSGFPEFGLSAILATVYFECCVYFWYTHRKRSAGSIVTVAGFLAWASVFPLAPFVSRTFATLHLENEVWNLPKYVVAVGMLLLLLERQIERSQYLALHDDLTSLANRRLFQDRLNSAIERARRSGTSMALMQIDLDRFKEVNDAHGHYVGDLLLQHVSRVFDARVRRSDTVARTGGDEFSVILEEPASRRDAEGVADSLLHLLSEPVQLAGTWIRTDASIGIAVFPEDAENPDSLCIAADMQMYQIKGHHRDKVGDMSERSPMQRESHTLAS